nr:hypothetical protein [Actinomadura sp. J1-007]
MGVVARLHDEAVAYAHDENVGHRERPAGGGDAALVRELGDDHLRVRGLVHDDVARPHLDRQLGDAGEVRAQAGAADQPGGGGGERVRDHGVLGVQQRQLRVPAPGHPVDQPLEDRARRGEVGHGSPLP